jgi:vacuolar-type H+-ATPase subunit D/Vma8|tara:strand:- start:2124 stop:2321 length:198 start_codon:yes stop_codon:yes gene_type:complete
MDIKVEHMDWGNKSNKKIKEELESLKHGHIALKNKIDTLLENLMDIEKEYYLGNTILNKRHKGIE